MRERASRFNGLQHPDAIHMCVTRPQTELGVVEAFARDLAEAVAQAISPPREKPISGAIYGGPPKAAPQG